MCGAILKAAFVTTSIRPFQDTLSVAHVSFPLTGIFGTALNHCHGPSLKRLFCATCSCRLICCSSYATWFQTKVFILFVSTARPAARPAEHLRINKNECKEAVWHTQCQ